MIGAIIGDIVGSRFEFNNHRSTEFELLHPSCFVTDDSVMTLAIGQALLDCRNDDGSFNLQTLPQQSIAQMQRLGRLYPDCSYGLSFARWLTTSNPQPYNSFGNGAAMRVSACGEAAKSIEEAKALSHCVTAVTHNHEEGLRGAEATAVAIFLAKTGHSQDEIKQYINAHYYTIDFTLDEIRPTYSFNETCQGTVPQALEVFFEATSFEHAMRLAISIGGDSDTLAAITGSVAAEYFGVPQDIRAKALTYMDQTQKNLLERFEALYPPKTIS